MKTKTETKQLVTKDMTIGEVVAKYPEAASIMLSYGLHCVGCAVNPYESIESGCLGHGMDKETIDNLVNDINKKMKEGDSKVKKAITITIKAAKKFKEFMKEEGKKDCGVKLTVHGSGCDGFQYGLDFTDEPTKTEKIFEDSGIKIFVEKESVDKVKGMTIDYLENEKGSGFKIDNPNSSSCGCHE